ncbi:MULTISPECIES: PTS glucose transporter subunit IIA [unclassified Lactobacillus]|uniref:PTS sugar transporter subunit IIA n=1 Tax=unclassified Lactobacillus TaxID=2620435 RepID=UPI000EFB5BC9|nr:MULTISPECIES: PTS glucose transporter subunit IIA [unclassified Lactobacillus]RMC23869.1 PTS glucose transporter subunit IIA [Lactobacillus sp. ESL0247]RMC27613.1 PTS glucose transporter subunit IIA [Lactobacillus sp. ESL0246]RMC30893.1 PTS glucose transporter subunit IIA [Lactobacillus sp. ESL0245]
MFKLFSKKVKSEIVAPVSGKLVKMNDVNDDIFSQKMMGDGFAIIPSGVTSEIVSPIDAEVIMIPETKHAIGLKSKQGLEILIHIGLETVNLNGKGFELLVNQGDKVIKKQPLLKIKPQFFIDNGYDPTTIVVFTKGYDKQVNPIVKYDSQVSAGDIVVK